MKKEVSLVVIIIASLFILTVSDFFQADRLERTDISNVVGFASSGASCVSDENCETGYICEGSVCSLGCLEDSECSEGRCDLESGRCVSAGCSSDSQCSGTTRWCDLSASTCVECYDQYHCSGDLICNLETNKCEEASKQQESSEEEAVAEETADEKAEENKGAEQAVDNEKTSEEPKTEEEKTPVEETFTLKEGETKELQLVLGAASSFKITLNKADKGGYSRELSYSLTNSQGGFGGSGNIKIGSKDVSLWSSISESTYLRINPVKRQDNSITFKVIECKDLSCLDDECPEYTYEEVKFVKGALSDWTKNAGSQRKLCSYEAEKTLEVLKEEEEAIEEKVEEKPIDSLNAEQTNNGGTLGDKYVAIKYEPDINYNLCMIEFYTGLKSPSSSTKLLVQVREDDGKDMPKPDVLEETKHALSSELSWQGTKFPSCATLRADSDYWIVIKVDDSNPDVLTPMSSKGESVKYKGSYSSSGGWDGSYSNNWMMKFYGEEIEVEEVEKTEEKMSFYQDSDEDGYGDKESVAEAASAPEGYVEDSTDCNDEDKSVHPGAAEIPNDNIDQDCDGEDLVKATCEDSDGKDLTEVGVVKYQDAEGKEKTFTDRCIGLVGVLEGQCNEDGSFTCLDEANCRNRCPEGQVCSEGACKVTEAQCTDSDGEDKNKAGEVSYTDENGGSQPKLTDQCLGYRFVKEGVCNFANQGRSKVLKCSPDEICMNGACVSSPEKCTDSDGADRGTKGTTTYTSRSGSSGQFVDVCSSNQAYVIEGLCKVDSVLTRAVPCPAGTVCSDGACIEGKPAVQFSCKDSDSYNIFTTGVVEYTDETGTHKKSEACLDSRTVSENYCVGTTLRTYNRICPTGYSCTAGRCVAVQQTSGSYWWR